MNLITINDCIFTDYIETSNPYINRKIKNIMLTYLNNKDYKVKKLQPLKGGKSRRVKKGNQLKKTRKVKKVKKTRKV